MRKYYLIIVGALFMIFTGVTMGQDGDSQIIAINRVMQIQMSTANQKQSIIVPSEPLSFDTVVEWEVTFTKKALASEKVAAYFKIEDLKTPAKQLEYKTVSSSGKLEIPKGTQYKITMCAGEYSLLVSREGALIQARIKYPEAQVRYSQGDKPYQLNFEIVGPSGLNNWSWEWGSADTTAGNNITHQFNSEGRFPVIVEGKGKMASGATSQKFYFDLEVPPLIKLDPKVEPLKGPVELSLTAKVNAVVNYGQKASYVWDFGNGTTASGAEVGGSLAKPGNYQISLTAKVAEYTFERNWVVEADPLTIITNPLVTPLSGPIPLSVTGTANSNVSGGPTQLKFSWELGKEIIEGNEFKYRFTEPGDYQLLCKTEDKLHPELVIPMKVFVIKALPPQLVIKPTASITKGLIPLKVNFEPNLTVSGAPVELVYHWDFGDGETSALEKPTHIFKKPGIFNIRLIIKDNLHQGNIAAASLNVEVSPPDMAVTIKSNTSSGLIPLTVNFTALVAVTGSPCDPQYFWDFGDGTTSVEQNPAHTYKQTGKYTVTLAVQDWLHPGAAVKTNNVIEAKMPKIRLTATLKPTSGPTPLMINCKASASEEGAANAKLKFVWDFGDGSVVEGMEQKHNYEKPGTYNVLVYVEDSVLGISERKTFKVVVK